MHRQFHPYRDPSHSQAYDQAALCARGVKEAKLNFPLAHYAADLGSLLSTPLDQLASALRCGFPLHTYHWPQSPKMHPHMSSVGRRLPGLQGGVVLLGILQ